MPLSYAEEERPFVLKPSWVGPATIFDTGAHALSRSGTVMRTPTYSSSRPGQSRVFPSQMLEPIPAGHPVPAASRSAPHASPTTTVYDMKGNPLYKTMRGPNGRQVRIPLNSPSSAHSAPEKPKIDYAMAPIQPATKPSFGRRIVPSVGRRTRIVDGAPLIRQEQVVTADPKKFSNGKGGTALAKRNSYRNPNPGASCPDCGNRQEVRVAGRLPHRMRVQ